MMGRAGRMPPVHPDLSAPMAVHVEGSVGAAPAEFRVRRDGGRVTLWCEANPDFWLDLDVAHARVRGGHLGAGYEVSFPTRRWSVMRVEHPRQPPLWVVVTVF
jgi:hypothetical protein